MTEETDRILDQAEIDSLLGLGNAPTTDKTRHAVERIINSGLVSFERLPMLEIVFDRLVRSCRPRCATSPATTSRPGSTTSSRCASATI